MRHFLAGIVLATSIIAHGFWRAGNKLHHVFGGSLVLLAAAIILPKAFVQRAKLKYRNRHPSGDE